MQYKKLYTLPSVSLDSNLANLVLILEPLRSKHLGGTTPAWMFFALKNLFQTIESVTSAQIEGNKTTIADYVDAARDGDPKQKRKDSIRMILNVEKGLDYIESMKPEDIIIDRDFILKLHKIAVEGLKTGPNDEGDKRAGSYRNEPRKISQSKHIPPPPSDVADLMKSLIDFINEPIPHQMELIKIATIHHRFVWIHPFGNGNGRVVRMITYAMLAKGGYINKDGARLLDPAAVFGADKFVYYDKLAAADDLSDSGSVEWAEYMLEGLCAESAKIDRLLDVGFTKRHIIIPAIESAFEKERITMLERDMLLICASNFDISARDFANLFPKGISHVNISQAIKSLRDKSLIVPVREGARKYNLNLNRNPITKDIIGKLDENGFLPPAQIIVS